MGGGTFRLFFYPLLLASLSSCQLPTFGPASPAQPESGPGGAAYKHAGVTQTAYGTGGTAYRLYEPADPVPQTAPLVVFVHGWAATNAITYGAWIKHLVQRGNLVVYPAYQSTICTPGYEFMPNLVQAVKDALVELETGNHVRPDLNKVAVVGHSAGGYLAAGFAARAGAEGLPQPRAVMSIEPVGSTQMNALRLPHEDLAAIPAGTLLLTVAGDRDTAVGTDGAIKIYYAAINIPPADKDYILFPTDTYGGRPMVADHYAPMTVDWEFSDYTMPLIALTIPPDIFVNTVNGMDFYGYWKLFDGLTDAAFYGINREYALGNTAQQRYMGRWSDGTPVAELQVMANPHIMK